MPEWTLDPELRALLCCPRCRGELLDREQGLECANCERMFPVDDGVPLLVDECALDAPTAQ